MYTKISKYILFQSFALLIGKIGFTQNLSPQSVNSCGSRISQGNSSISFTVGELIVSNQADILGNTLAGGYTVGATLTAVNVQETKASVIEVKVFPNPTAELLNIHLIHSTLEQIILTITELGGSEVFKGKYASITNLIGINTTAYAPGIYFLAIKNTNDQILGTYKIIKH
jgi:hypothetical protein